MNMRRCFRYCYFVVNKVHCTLMPAETSFSVLLVINDCVVGNGKYFMTHETVTILHEYGACTGFLIKPLKMLQEARIRRSSSHSSNPGFQQSQS